MQARKVPIDGVGLQFHWDLEHHDSLTDVAANMKRLGDLGLEVHITELDIKCTPKGSCVPCP
jgi:endo-1,4-beta-xylanase